MKARKFINELLSEQKKSFVVIISFSIIISIFTSLAVYLQKIMIDDLTGQNFKPVMIIVIVTMIIQIILYIMQKIASIYNFKFSTNLSEQFNHKVTKKINILSLENMENKETIDLIDRIQSVISYINENTLNSINIVFCIISIIGLAITLISVKWYFTLIIIGLALPYYLLIQKQGFDNYLLEVENNTATRRLNYLFDMLTIREYAKEIRTFRLKKYLSDKFFHIRNKIWLKKKKLLLKHSVLIILVTLLKNLSLLVCFIITCFLILNKQTTLGSLMLVISATEGMMTNIKQIMNLMGGFNQQNLYLNDLDHFLSMTDEACGDEDFSDNTITFNHVNFSYPNSAKPAISDLNITIHPNEKIAIVGDNGSGKSTFIKLLLGLYQPTSGHINVGGKPLPRVLSRFRQRVACVFQDFIKYQYTVRENIDIGNYGNHNSEFYDSNHLQFCDFVSSLPEEFETPLGRLDKNGRDISGGEWQKLAICRAIGRENTSFLILDEPLSALDPLVETELYVNFKEVCGSKTAILISHRLSATQVCDKIYVFDKGTIIEDGTHNELMLRKGKYFKMFTTQRRLYL